MPQAIQFPTPDEQLDAVGAPSWLKPENASVFDPPWRGPMRDAVALVRLVTGADDPKTQVVAGAALENPQAVGGALKVLGDKFPRLAKAIKAFHGSPHDFEAFDASKIGTGEGAQAYGHGLYFAENPQTAEVYKKALGGDALKMPDGSTLKPTPGSVEDRALSFLATYQDSGMGISNPYSFARKEVQQMIDRGTGSNRPGELDTLKKIKDTLWNWEESGVRAGSGGKTYEVAIKADPEHFLDWDKPLSQQPPNVQHALGKVIQEAPNGYYSRFGDTYLGKDPSGKALYDAATAYRETLFQRQGVTPASREGASAFLKDKGIPGIKYLDQGSRGTGEGTRNYVVFPGNEYLIEILKKYGLLLPASGAALYEAQQQGTPHAGPQ